MRWVSLFAALCTLACLGLSQTTFETTWQGRTYKLVLAEGLDWDQARTAAESNGGFLATVTSTGEHQVMISLLQQVGAYNNVPNAPQPHHNFWLAGSRALNSEVWRWQTGPEDGSAFFRGLGDAGECLQALCPWRLNFPGSESSSGSEPNAALSNNAYMSLGVGISNTNVQFNFQWNDLNLAGETIKGYFMEMDPSPFVPSLPSAEASVVFVGETSNPDMELSADGFPNASVVVRFAALHKMAGDGETIEATYEYSALSDEGLIVAPSFLVNNDNLSPDAQRRGEAYDFSAAWADEVALKLRLGGFSSGESRTIEFADARFRVERRAVKLGVLLTPLEQQDGVEPAVWRLDLAFENSATIGPFVSIATKSKKISGEFEFGTPRIVSHTLSTEKLPGYGGRRAHLRLSLLNFALVDQEAIPTPMPEPVFWPDLAGVSVYFPEASEVLVYDPDVSVFLSKEDDESDDHTVLIVAVTASVGGVAALVVLSAVAVAGFLWWRAREAADEGVVGLRDAVDATL